MAGAGAFKKGQSERDEFLRPTAPSNMPFKGGMSGGRQPEKKVMQIKVFAGKDLDRKDGAQNKATDVKIKDLIFYL